MEDLAHLDAKLPALLMLLLAGDQSGSMRRAHEAWHLPAQWASAPQMQSHAV